MSNNAAGLNAFLDAQLNDAADTVWPAADKDNVILWAVAGLYPHISRVIDPSTATIDLTPGTYFYALPTGILNVSRVEYINTAGDEVGSLANGSWELTGDPLLGTALIHIAPSITDADGTVRVHGYGRYDTTSNLIPDEYVPLVLALARAELYRRTAGDRARYQEWMSRQQVQNVSVNELLQMVNEADNEAKQLRTRYRTWQKPVPGRVP